jgi:LPS sulfotransferase NodH
MRDELRFENIVRDLDVDDATFQRGMENLSPADRTYVVMFSARSGSTWLTSVLSGTDQLGYPEEYLNPNFVRAVAKSQNSRDPVGVLQMLKRRRKTPNGVFGIEVRHIDVELFGQRAFFQIFDRGTVFFHLWRDDIVAQGISLYRAVSTQQFHSTTEGESLAVPSYDADGISHWITHVASTENNNVRLLEREGCHARGLRYEDIVEDRAGTIEVFARVLDVPLEPGAFAEPMEGEFRKVGDDWNVDAQQKFRLERADFVANVEAARLIKIGVEVAPGKIPDADGAIGNAEPDAAYVDGQLAGVAGRSPRSNPYVGDVDQSTRWLAGWNNGWDTQPRVPREPVGPYPRSSDYVEQGSAEY